MKVKCKRCGVQGLKRDMLYSRHTGNAYCRDEIECARRKFANKNKEGKNK